MKKYLCVIEIKPECKDEYLAIHKVPWRGMLEAIRDAGYVNGAIWYYKDQSIIYLECPDDVTHEECNARLRATDVCKRWDVTVCPWFASDPAMAPKIFDLNQQLGDGLRED
ncbi:MAG: L-rhamnose mutarotase [Clostridiales Family XIII bacterium]|jgi:L-rhamnose mutarotase|nr:L-rhamnose mutarotase [Clostridiales Family XIII bacterium]